MTIEYQNALNRVREAGKKFDAARKAFREKAIGDEEFLAAMREYNQAEKDFDAAFSEEQERGE